MRTIPGNHGKSKFYYIFNLRRFPGFSRITRLFHYSDRSDPIPLLFLAIQIKLTPDTKKIQCLPFRLSLFLVIQDSLIPPTALQLSLRLLYSRWYQGLVASFGK
jgi:hypothetical protein